MARKGEHRRLRTQYAVLGDGRTEQFYLQHLKSLNGYKYRVYPSLFDDITIDIVETKIDELISGACDLVVYFMDYDVIVNQRRYDDFKNLKRKYEVVPEVIICESMPSIEYWFLLHYKKTTKEFSNASEVCKELQKYIVGFSKGRDFLKNPKWVKNLCSDGRIEKAIQFAGDILNQKEKQDVGSHFPFTKAHLGIEQFEKQKK